MGAPNIIRMEEFTNRTNKVDHLGSNQTNLRQEFEIQMEVLNKNNMIMILVIIMIFIVILVILM